MGPHPKSTEARPRLSFARGMAVWLCALLAALALWLSRAAAQQNNILANASEAQIANLFTTGAPYNPVLSTNSYLDVSGLFSGQPVASCQIIAGMCYDSAGYVTSAAYDLGNGLYLYAYEVQSDTGGTILLNDNFKR